MKKYYKEIDIMRGFAITLVLLGHSFISSPINTLSSPIAMVIYNLIYKIHMPTFFLLAGFCFKTPENFIGLKKYYKNKFFRILLPFIVFSIADLIPRVLFPQLVNNQTNIVDGIILAIIYGGSLWFLHTLFVMFAFAPLLKFCKNKFLYIILPITFVLIKISIQLPKEFSINGVFHSGVFFLVGWVLSLVDKEKLFDKLKSPVVILLGLLFFISPFIKGLSANAFYVVDIFIAFAGMILLYNLSVLLTGKLSNLFIYMGKYSLQFYVLSGFFIVIGRVICGKLTFMNSPITIICFMFIFQLIACNICILIINKFKILRILSGVSNRV